ncbi:MAG: hypothetical protein QGF00_10285 [Planctomycetota bacterium]|jgi:hypothetical protein|nr:hypothetical protein [Planctomycetota bacterium]MDP7249979.1 hypothetical protein [Planctomycetota bacterium]
MLLDHLLRFRSAVCIAPDMPLIIRKAAGGSLQSLAENQRLIPIDAAELEERERSTSAKIEVLNRTCNEIGDEDDFSAVSLSEQAHLEIGCLFHLLSLQFDPDKINRISHNLFSQNSVLRANAIELLDDLLPLRLSPIIKLLEPLVEKQGEQGMGLSIETANEVMKCEAWPRVLAAYHMNGSDPDAVMQLTDGEKRIYDLVGVVSALKGVSIFRNVPGNYMVALAMVVTWPRTVRRGRYG